jgi:hypothetical protein
MTKSIQRPIRVGDKVVPDASTHDRGTIRLGDNTPTFRTSGKVVSNTETADQSQGAPRRRRSSFFAEEVTDSRPSERSPASVG